MQKHLTTVALVAVGVIVAGIVMDATRKKLDIVESAHMGFAANT
ncbi:MAG: hypothetical protein ACFCUQ_10075 [Kiloniellales bacterium]